MTSSSPPLSVAATPQRNPYPLLLSLQQRSLRAADIAELGFVIANDTWQLASYGQAYVFIHDRLGHQRLQTVSGLAVIEGETPFTLWLSRMSEAAGKTFPEDTPQRLEAAMFDDELAAGWGEWWPEHGLLIPLTARNGRRVGVVLFARDEPWEDEAVGLIGTLAGTWGYCTHALLGDRPTFAEYWERLRQHPRRRQLVVALAVALLFPVRMSALAPAEIIPLQAEAIAAPMDGVVARFHVRPNASVKTGELMLTLDDTTLRNRRQVALQALGVARAEALAAQQKAFDNAQSKADLASLIGKVREREAELAYLDEAMGRVDIKAPFDGVLVYGDPNDWIGKPVTTGERIAQLARPDDLGVMMWLPVGDAINLEPGADMRVYLQTAPLSSLSARLLQTSYQAILSPEGIASYRIRGQLETGSDARIGSRGVGKVYGSWVPLAYYVLRRPLGALRQWMGI